MDLAEGAVTIGVRSQFQSGLTRILQNFDKMTSQARPHWRNKKQRLGEKSNPPENMLYTAMRSPRRRRLCKECQPSRRSRSLYGSRWKPFLNLVSNRWICSKQSALSTRFGKQACTAYSRWGRTNISEKAVNTDTGNSANDRLSIGSYVHTARKKLISSIQISGEHDCNNWLNGVPN